MGRHEGVKHSLQGLGAQHLHDGVDRPCVPCLLPRNASMHSMLHAACCLKRKAPRLHCLQDLADVSQLLATKADAAAADQRLRALQVGAAYAAHTVQ